jgi:hypothetical protein
MKLRSYILLALLPLQLSPLFGQQDYDFVKQETTSGHIWYQTSKVKDHEVFFGVLNKNREVISACVCRSVHGEIDPNGHLLFFLENHRYSTAKHKLYVYDESGHKWFSGDYLPHVSIEKFVNRSTYTPMNKIYAFQVENDIGQGAVYDNGVTIVPCGYCSLDLWIEPNTGLVYSGIKQKVNNKLRQGIYANGREIFSPIYENVSCMYVDTSIGKFPYFSASKENNIDVYKDIFGNTIQNPKKQAEEMVQTARAQWNSMIDKADYTFTFTGSKEKPGKARIGVIWQGGKSMMYVLINNKFIVIPIKRVSKKEFAFLFLQDESLQNVVYFYEKNGEVVASFHLRSYGLEDVSTGGCYDKNALTSLRNRIHGN